MRVLWFSVTPSLFNQYSNSYNGGGWIASLEQIIKDDTNIELGIAFICNSERNNKIIDDRVTYYPIKSESYSIFYFKNRDKRIESSLLEKYLKVIEDYKPDIIQVFGSENTFGLICNRINIPVVIHIQGSIPPYLNAVFPIEMNTYDFFFGRHIPFRYRIMGLRTKLSFKKKARREIEIFRSCKYFMGRTKWDNNLVNLFNPSATYFHCDEALRDSFISSNKCWKGLDESKIIFISVISSPWYKGFDLILKTADLLNRFTNIDFIWNVFGVNDVAFYEAKYGIKAKNVNVNVRGIADKNMLIDELCSTTLYIHSSYIDNSPNSLCEAQYLGVPVIATNVGGISSIIEDGKTGILFPANDPFTLAATIKKVISQSIILYNLSQQERIMAVKRHNPQRIKNNLISIYDYIIDNE